MDRALNVCFDSDSNITIYQNTSILFVADNYFVNMNNLYALSRVNYQEIMHYKSTKKEAFNQSKGLIHTDNDLW